ncbi:hypothetical protein SEUCBS139899_000711 [Sporothrix eucalyptigena]
MTNFDEKTSGAGSTAGPLVTEPAEYLEDAGTGIAMPQEDVPSPYRSLSFYCAFFSISFGFYAAILGMSVSWNQLQGAVPAAIGTASTWAFPTLFFSHTTGCFFFGRLTDYIGRRWPFVVCNILSFVGFIASGRVSTTSPTPAIAGLAVLIGLGTSLQVQGPFLALSELVPVKQRFGVVALSCSLLAPLYAMNPAISTALTLHTAEGWRWVYFINAILSFVSAVGLLVFYHPQTVALAADDEPFVDEPEMANVMPRKDWLGLGLMTLFIALLTFPTFWGGSGFAWLTGQTIALITIFGIAFVLYLFYTFHWGNAYTAIPNYVIREWASWSWIAVCSFNSQFFWFVPITAAAGFKTVFGEGGMQLGWDVSVWSAGIAAGWILVILCLGVAKPFLIKWQMAIAMFVQCTALYPINVADQYHHALMVALFIVSALGEGYGMVLSHTACVLNVHRRDMGLATGGAAALRGIVFAIFLAIFQTIYGVRLTNVLAADVSAAAVAAGLPQAELPHLFAAITATQAGANTTVFFTDVANMTDAILDATIQAELTASANGWRFIFLFALVALIPFFLYTLFLPQLDRRLDGRVWARLVGFGRNSAGGSGANTLVGSRSNGTDKGRREQSSV